MHTFDTHATRQALEFQRLIPAVRDLFVTGCEVPLRHTHQWPDAAGGSGAVNTVLLMPAWQGEFLGIKTVTIFPNNAALGLPGLHSTYTLYSARTGQPLAHMDGNEITSRRTAAASALAASCMAAPDARTLLVVGCGRVGSLVPEAFSAVLPIDRVLLWDRTPARAQALAQRLCAAGVNASAAGDLQAAVRQADVVSCATLATEPLVQGHWLRPHSHLDLIGSFTPAMREADDACFAHARLVVDTPEALQKSGELLGPLSRGVFTASSVAGTLADMCQGSVQGRLPTTGRTVFKSVGNALEDLAAAMLVWQQHGGLPTS